MHIQPISCVFTWVVSLSGAHTTHQLCFHLGSVPQWCTHNSTAVYLCTHGPCSHLCSVLWWSAYNNTICTGTTCVLTSAVSFGGLPTATLSVQALPVFSPLQCPLVVCLQQHYLCRHYLCSHLCSVLWQSAYNNTICAGTTHVLNSVVSFSGLPTATLSVHALPVFSPL